MKNMRRFMKICVKIVKKYKNMYLWVKHAKFSIKNRGWSFSHDLKRKSTLNKYIDLTSTQKNLLFHINPLLTQWPRLCWILTVVSIPYNSFHHIYSGSGSLYPFCRSAVYYHFMSTYSVASSKSGLYYFEFS